MANYAISNVPRRVVYAASGTGPYAFTFEILAASDIAVYKGDTLLTLTTDYTVTINSNGTGSVTLTTSAGTSAITIVGSKTIARTTDFTTGGDFFANTLNDELDAQTIFIQQVSETAERGLKAPVTDPTDINMTLPRKADRAGKYLAFDANGNPQPGPNAVDINTVVGIASDITTVSGISSQVTTVANNNANVTTVATNIANVNTNATNIASINTNASNIVAIQNASANASTATTKASEAAASASAASTSASNASTSATNAANSASAASTSASNASASETAAANSASAAASSAAQAANRVAKTSDTGSAVIPSGTTAQRDGSPANGYLRYNSTLSQFEGYAGGVWGGIGGGASAGGVIYENATTISSNYTLTSSRNGFSVGPITINSGVSVTVPSGQRWVVL